MAASDGSDDPKGPKDGDRASSGAAPASKSKKGKARTPAAGTPKSKRRSRPIAVPATPESTTPDPGSTSTAIPTAAQSGPIASTATGVPRTQSGAVEVSTSAIVSSHTAPTEISAATGVPPAIDSGPISERVDVPFSELDDEDGPFGRARRATTAPPVATARAVSEMAAPEAPEASDSGSVDVAFSGRTPVVASDSGSVDVAFSGRTPVVASESGSIDISTSSTDGTPGVVADIDSAPVSSGKVRAVVAGEATGRSKRLTSAAKDKLGAGVSAGVSAIGSGIGTIGENVSKLGDISKKVPLVGSNISKLGEGISNLGESVHELPRVAGTRRGRLLFRSLIVGFVLVATWIVVIVGLQLHGNDAPDFRPMAERVLVELSGGPDAIEDIYDEASPRFQEMVRKERFIDDMSDLAATVGKFKEITAINDTLVTNGPTGRVGRVSLTVAYEKATCRASVSLHSHEGQWKLLGVGVELPPELKITQAQREERVQACKDPMSKSCDLYVTSNLVLEQLRDGKADAVWDSATQVFQKQEEKSRFMQIQAEHAAILGNYVRIIAVTEARVIGGTNATFDVLTEYVNSAGVRAIFGFYRRSKTNPWKLRSLKIVLPMPRADQQVAVPAAPDGPTPGDDMRPVAGSGSEGSATPAPTKPPPKRPKQEPTRPAGAGSRTEPPPPPAAGSADPAAGNGSSATPAP